ncbi:unnamed protein product [Soboliphyme baturini]|uniref:Phosphotransferase n=1 Tax=Soboliphyme baturini TaxID=241478 RepID=A0A183IV45_9BILA|nr:unnamed protein product [Soboliphyme baturini]
MVECSSFHAQKKPYFLFEGSNSFSFSLTLFFQVYQELKKLELSDAQLRQMMSVMEKELDKGLALNSNSCIKMLPSFVRSLPNGTEVGDYLALDLGGTNFRVLLIRLNKREAEMKHHTYRIPQSLMSGNGETLFDHIANCLSKFVKENELEENLPLGFTFSFPCQQVSLTDAKLISWTKGFNCKDVVGANVVDSLRDAIARRNDVAVEVIALLNDTVGTQMALAHRDSNCHIGVIVGTGTNACYTEKLSRCPKLNDTKSEEVTMIINTEWGAFGDNGCIDFLRSPFDDALDGCIWVSWFDNLSVLDCFSRAEVPMTCSRLESFPQNTYQKSKGIIKETGIQNVAYCPRLIYR